MRSGSEEYSSLYPEPPQSVFASPSLSMSHHITNIAAPPISPISPDDLYRHQDVFSAATFYDQHQHPHPHHQPPQHQQTHFHVYNALSPATMYAEDPDMHLSSSSLSPLSGASAPSSAVGSPRSHNDLPISAAATAVPEWSTTPRVSVTPGIVGQAEYYMSGEFNDFQYPASGMDEYVQLDFPGKSYVADPSVLHPEVRPMGVPAPFEAAVYASAPPSHHLHHTQHHQPPPLSFTLSPATSPDLRAGSVSPFHPNSSTSGTLPHYSPSYLATHTPMAAPSSSISELSRRGSQGSFSGYSAAEPAYSDDGDGKEKQVCPHADCGRRYKDLRAHMLTHQNERPEKCPIQTCEYHTKGFARKYDKNRHTLTHYKGTMVCGFCPGSGSPAEKSFNRADVFKRHLTAVHGVEQSPPNSRKKGMPGSGPGGAQSLATYASDATGKCSTCSQTFSNAQEFYEHLDDCVLRIVQQEDPAEAVNASRLAEVENDAELKETLEKNQLPTTPAMGEDDVDVDDEPMNDEDDGADEDLRDALSSPRRSKTGSFGSFGSSTGSGNPPGGVQKSRGMTHSRGGVPASGKRSRRSRRNYPTSWGFDKGQMTMRKRVMTVFEGPRRLAKDDMMLSTEHEVRLKLSDGKAYVTDLDVQTMKRAEGFLQSTDEEKGPWISDDPTDEELLQMQQLQQMAPPIQQPVV